jgi:hypothetical protein
MRDRISRAGETDSVRIFEQTCHTLLSQCHLAPLPLSVQPVHWELDASLSLFPQPDVLVTAMNAPACSVDVHDVKYAPTFLASDANMGSLHP